MPRAGAEIGASDHEKELVWWLYLFKTLGLRGLNYRILFSMSSVVNYSHVPHL